MKFPPLVADLINCPGLLRLRDVRMANNQFVSFPAFASTSRYEHSLGVCHLAGLCSKSLELSEKDTLELMMAGLYHDVGTPPFAHAMEEILHVKFGFDHEQNLKDVIMDMSDEPLGDKIQIFLGAGLKLRSICQKGKARELGLDQRRIAKIAAGDKNEYLSPLLNGDGMDLDNIDNIIRASSAMGLIPNSYNDLAIKLACSFVLSDNQILYNGFALGDIKKWQNIRDIQYTAIYNSIDDFAYQTMIKKAIHLLMNDKSQKQINRNSWTLTDSQIVNDYLLEHPQSQRIMKRVLLCNPYHCLGILYVQGDGVIKYVNQHLDEIEYVASDFYIETLGITSKKLDSINTLAVVANFYPDKRKRKLIRNAIVWNEETTIDDEVPIPQGVLLGLFTPFANSNHKDIQAYDNKIRKVVSFSTMNLLRLMGVLKDTCLHDFTISIFGSELGEQSSTSASEDQLGLF
jgi:HD superfamily phosphohydrolase